MVYKLIYLDWDDEFVSVLRDKKYLKTYTTSVFDDYGVIWYKGHAFDDVIKYMKENNIKFDENKLTLVISDERKWLLTKIKYGI